MVVENLYVKISGTTINEVIATGSVGVNLSLLIVESGTGGVFVPVNLGDLK